MSLILAKFIALSEQYTEQFPNEEPIESYSNELGFSVLQDVLENREGRKIIFTPDINAHDLTAWSYEEEAL